MVVGVGLAPTLFLMWQIYSLRPSLLGDTQPLAPLVGLAPAKLLDENQGTLLICLQRHLLKKESSALALIISWQAVDC